MNYYKKELLSTPLYLPQGRRVPFEDVGGDTGVVATEDGSLIVELDGAVKRRIGGIVVINQGTYDDLKKNTLKPLRRNSSLSAQSVQSTVGRLSRENPAALDPRVPPPPPLVPQVNTPPPAPVVVPENIPNLRRIGKGRGRPPRESVDFVDAPKPSMPPIPAGVANDQ